MEDDLRTAIEELDKLFAERSDAGWWSQNIIDASKHIKSKNSWTKFYAYMYSPQNFDPSNTYTTIEDCKEEADLSLHRDLEEIRYENGPDTTIHVRVRNQEDEKTN